MPQRDGTGPDGKGPKTGKGKGDCADPKDKAKKESAADRVKRFLDA